MTKPLSLAAGGHNAGPDQSRAEMMDVRAVAALLNCSARHVVRLADAAKMPPPRKLGCLSRWSRRELEAWIVGGCKPVGRAA